PEQRRVGQHQNCESKGSGVARACVSRHRPLPLPLPLFFFFAWLALLLVEDVDAGGAAALIALLSAPGAMAATGAGAGSAWPVHLALRCAITSKRSRSITAGRSPCTPATSTKGSSGLKDSEKTGPSSAPPSHTSVGAWPSSRSAQSLIG